MAKSEQRKIQCTKNYRLFCRSDENRPLDLKKHKKLYASMKQYGFLPCFPVVCIRNGVGPRIVKDGQHRLAIAESLGLPVHYVDEATDFDVAIINSTPKTWTVRDYADKYALHGKKPYAVGIEFAERHGVPIGIAFALLGGTTSFGNVADEFMKGDFAIKNLNWAERVGSTYSALVNLSTALRNVRFLEACMAAAHVDGFDTSRLIHNAKQCRDKLVAYSTRDAFLEMMEYVFNFKRQKTMPLKFLAIQAMRARSPLKPKHK